MAVPHYGMSNGINVAKLSEEKSPQATLAHREAESAVANGEAVSTDELKEMIKDAKKDIKVPGSKVKADIGHVSEFSTIDLDKVVAETPKDVIMDLEEDIEVEGDKEKSGAPGDERTTSTLAPTSPPPTQVSEPPKVEGKVVMNTDQMNAHAEVLLRIFPPHVKDQILYHAKNKQVTLWQYIGGLINYCNSSGLMSSAQIDQVWLSNSPIKEVMTTCGYCKKEYEPEFRGQLFCSEDCGRANEEEVTMEAKLEQKKKRREEKARLEREAKR